jgi:hypothetical protein
MPNISAIHQELMKIFTQQDTWVIATVLLLTPQIKET